MLNRLHPTASWSTDQPGRERLMNCPKCEGCLAIEHSLDSTIQRDNGSASTAGLILYLIYRIQTNGAVKWIQAGMDTFAENSNRSPFLISYWKTSMVDIQQSFSIFSQRRPLNQRPQFLLCSALAAYRIQGPLIISRLQPFVITT